MEKKMYRIYCGIMDVIEPDCVAMDWFSSEEEALDVAKQKAIEFYKAKSYIIPTLTSRNDVVREYLEDTGFPEDHDVSESIDANAEIDDWYEEIIKNSIVYYVKPQQIYKVYAGISGAVEPECVLIKEFVSEQEAIDAAKQEALKMYKKRKAADIVLRVFDPEDMIVYHVEPWKLDIKFDTFKDVPCVASFFKINDIEVEEDDFGEQYDRKPVNSNTKCGCMKFTSKPATEEILNKYGISESEYNEVCTFLEDRLSFEACDKCIENLKI